MRYTSGPSFRIVNDQALLGAADKSTTAIQAGVGLSF